MTHSTVILALLWWSGTEPTEHISEVRLYSLILAGSEPQEYDLELAQPLATAVTL